MTRVLDTSYRPSRVGSSIRPNRSQNFGARAARVIEVGFFLFLLLVMVRFGTGEADSVEARVASLQATQNGDVVKQILYTIIFVAACGLWIFSQGARLPLSLSKVQVLLMAWILLSSSWAFVPDVSFRRGVLLTYVFTTIAISTDLLGPVRTLKALYNALAVCLLLSLFAVVFVPSVGVHPLTETDPSIAGGWRGIFVHKNTAGGVIAMAALIFLHFGINEKKWRHWILFALALFFIVFSKSKTPFGLLLLVLPCGLYYRKIWTNATYLLMLMLLCVGGAIVIAIGITEYFPLIADIFTDPRSFTGRVAIWTAALQFARDHFWLGSGYSSLWNVSSPPPIYPYIREQYLEFITHSHNGYLEIFATTGIVGITLAILGAIVIPLGHLIKNVTPRNASLYALLFSVWFYGALENLTETQLYTRDREIWVVYFIAILVLQNLARKRKIPSDVSIGRVGHDGPPSGLQ